MGRRRQPKRYTLEIESLSHEGRGVARHEGKTVFVDLALPGEEVEAERFRKRSRFDEAIATGILTAAPQRTEPPCPNYARCGAVRFNICQTRIRSPTKARCSRN